MSAVHSQWVVCREYQEGDRYTFRAAIVTCKNCLRQLRLHEAGRDEQPEITETDAEQMRQEGRSE